MSLLDFEVQIPRGGIQVNLQRSIGRRWEEQARTCLLFPPIGFIYRVICLGMVVGFRTSTETGTTRSHCDVENDIQLEQIFKCTLSDSFHTKTLQVEISIFYLKRQNASKLPTKNTALIIMD